MKQKIKQNNRQKKEIKNIKKNPIKRLKKKEPQEQQIIVNSSNKKFNIKIEDIYFILIMLIYFILIIIKLFYPQVFKS